MRRNALALGLLLIGVASVIAGIWWMSALALQQAHQEGLTLWQLVIGYHVREPFWSAAGSKLVPILLLVLVGASLTVYGYARLEEVSQADHDAKRGRQDNAVRVIGQELQVGFDERTRLSIKVSDSSFKRYRFESPQLSSFEVLRDEAEMPYLAVRDESAETLARVEQINARVRTLPN